jgi:hypothetical protein
MRIPQLVDGETVMGNYVLSFTEMTVMLSFVDLWMIPGYSLITSMNTLFRQLIAEALEVLVPRQL